MEKNFIKNTRPSTRKEAIKFVRGVERQIKYWIAIGHSEYDITHWKKNAEHIRKKFSV